MIRPEDNPDKIIWTVFSSLKEKNEASRNTPRIYFSGEFDSNQTKFERMSNHLKIGVIANDKKVGLALLRILRFIIDQYTDLIYCDIESVIEKGKELTVDALINEMGASEEMYMASFELDATFTVELKATVIRTEIIQKRITDVDIYDFPRLEEYLEY